MLDICHGHLALTPPQGAWMKAGWQQFFHMMPTRSLRVTRSQRASSAEKTAPASPYSVAFATATASSSLRNSCWYMFC